MYRLSEAPRAENGIQEGRDEPQLKGSSQRLSDEDREHSWGRTPSPVRSLQIELQQKQSKRELDELWMGSTKLPVPGVSVLMGASRALLEAVPGAARQSHRKG